jgi:iron complex outermembrane receptor protein
MKTYILPFLLLLFLTSSGVRVYAQTDTTSIKQKQFKVSEMSKEQLMQLTYDDLLLLSFDDLILVSNKFGMSSDELLEFFLNKEITSASKRAEKSINSPLSTTVISRDELINSGAISIPEALRLVPGMIVREKTNGNYDVHIRGNDNLPPKGMFVYSENSISLIMIDGRPVYNYSFGGTFWESMPISLNDVERIEVIRGPSSALYGPNAVSGAINIITRKVETNKLHVDGGLQIGTTNSKIADLSAAFGAGTKFKVRLSGNYTHFDRFEKNFYNFENNQFYSAAEMDTLHTYQYNKITPASILAEENFSEKFSDPSLANDHYGANAFISFVQNQNISADLAVGAQQSEIISNALGNTTTPYSGRTSNTQYIDFKTDIYGFHAQANYMIGDQFVQKNYPGWHIEPKVFNGSLEYEKKIGTLTLRPGVSFQNTTYDDSKWGNATKHDGFLNGLKTIRSFAYFLRADYKLMDKLRLIGAVRADKYNKPDKTYFTYQFISSYDINENNVVRAVYSRANRGPFISDSYADYYWPIVTNFYTLHYEGNQNMKLPTLDMFELGYRTKIAKRVMVELEAFHSEMKNLIFFTPDQMTLYFNSNPTLDSIVGHGQYQNLNLKSIQNGITANISVVVNSKLNFKVFGTYQQSKIKNFYNRTIWNDFTSLTTSCMTQFKTDYMTTGTVKDSYTATYSTFADSSNASMDNKATPSFYGGLMADYAPVKKLNINTSLYFYSKQTIMLSKIESSSEDMYSIDPKMIVNLKVSYKVWKDNSIFFNARNLLNNDKREFAYMDAVKGTYLVGINFNF